jgi:hypothetical protein
VEEPNDRSVVEGTGFSPYINLEEPNDDSVVEGTGFSPYINSCVMKGALAPEERFFVSHQIRTHPRPRT